MSAAAPAMLLTVAVKATVLLMLAGAGLLVARRASAAFRHWVAFLALASVLLLPVLPLVLPALDLRILPAEAGAGAADARAPASEAAPLAAMAVAMWIAGVALHLVRLSSAHLRAARLRREAVPLGSWSWRQVTAEVGRGLALHSRVPVLAHAGVRVPIVVGILRPAVIVPEAAAAWTAGHRRAVLIHEMAHVRRRDCLTQLVAELAVALFWFHPLAWGMARVMRHERELACDDFVLAQGARPSGYATLLLRLRGFMFAPRAAPLGAVAFGLRSGLMQRIESLLAQRSRRLLTADHHFWLASAALVLLLPLAAARAVRAAPAAPPLPAVAVAAPPVAAAPPPAPVRIEEPAPAREAPVAPAAPRARIAAPHFREPVHGSFEARFSVQPIGFRFAFVIVAEVRTGR